MVHQNVNGKQLHNRLYGIHALNVSAILFPPLNKLIPSHRTFTTLIPRQLDAPSEVLSDTPSPTSLNYRTIDGLDLVPPLFWRHIGKVCGGHGSSGSETSGKK